MHLRYAVRTKLAPALSKKYKSIREGDWTLRAVSGIATNDTTMIRVGIRNSSDLVSIGIAPNLAARLSEQRLANNDVFIGGGTYKELSNTLKLADDVNIWNGPHTLTMGGSNYTYYRTKYHRTM